VSDADKAIDRRGRWDLLKPLKLSSKTKNELKKYMPGFSSNLQGLYGDPATSSLEEMLKAGKKQYTNCRGDSGLVASY